MVPIGRGLSREGTNDGGGAGATEVAGEPGGGLHERGEVDSVVDAEAAQEPDQVLGGEVAGGALREGAAAETAGAGVVRRDAGAQSGLDVRAYVSMCFGDPWEGAVPVDQVVEVGKRLFDLGASQLSLGDTIGVGTAGHVTDLLDAFNAAGLSDDVLAVHFHDTYGQALANAHAALRHGIRTFDASAGGLGGCPYAESATGNLATEDLVWLLHGLGIETGVDLDALVATSVWMAGVLGRPSPSRVVNALA